MNDELNIYDDEFVSIELNSCVSGVNDEEENHSKADSKGKCVSIVLATTSYDNLIKLIYNPY